MESIVVLTLLVLYSDKSEHRDCMSAYTIAEKKSDAGMRFKTSNVKNKKKSVLINLNILNFVNQAN